MQPMSTASLHDVARQLTMDIDLNACGLLQPGGPVLCDAGSTLMLHNTQFSRHGLLYGCGNDTAAAGQKGRPVGSIRLNNNDFNHQIFGMDFLLK